MGLIQFKTNIPVSHHKNNFLLFRLETFPSWENCPHCPSPPSLRDVQTRVNQALPAVRKAVQSSTVHQKHSASYEYDFQCFRSHGKKSKKETGETVLVYLTQYIQNIIKSICCQLKKLLLSYFTFLVCL